MTFAFVRNLRTTTGANLKHFSQIQSAEAHAKRVDLTSQKRKDSHRDHASNYFWSKAGTGLDDGGADYSDAYRAHKAELGVKSERKGAALGLHLLVGVSPEWLSEEGGDPRDTSNKRVKQLIDEAKAWAESWLGEGAVWGVRYDTDEKGAGVVDILASPVRQNRAGRGKPKPTISVNKAFKELQTSVGTQNSYEAMQTSWAAHAQRRLDAKLKRGVSKELTRKEHLYPEEYKKFLAAKGEFDMFEERARQMALELEQERREIQALRDEANEEVLKAEQKRIAEDKAATEACEAARIAELEKQKIDAEKEKATADLNTASAELQRTKAELEELAPAHEELKSIKAEVAEQKTLLQSLKDQAHQVVESAKAEARKAATIIVREWQEFQNVPQPFRQALNNLLGLREAVAETLEQLGIARTRPDLGDKNINGEPPPVLELVMDRAEKKAQRKNELLNTHSPGMGR